VAAPSWPSGWLPHASQPFARRVLAARYATGGRACGSPLRCS
jgi:hypothetical protein